MRGGSRRTLGTIAIVVLTTCLGACGGGTRPTEQAPGSSAAAQTEQTDEGQSAVAAGAGLPVTVTNADGSETVIRDTSRIVVLNGDLAEVVWALGLGDQVVATDVSATYPAEAKALPKIGYQRTLNAEGILSFDPTVVLGNRDAGPPSVLEQLRTAGVPVAILAYEPTLEGAATKIELVGRALGAAEEAERLVRDLEAEVADALTLAEDYGDRPKAALLYLRGANVRLIAGAGSGADALFEAIGAVDVASESGIEETVPITAEGLVALAPEVIVTTTAGLESVGGIAGLLDVPGVAETPAGRNRRVLAYDDQLLLGFGPRLGELLDELARDVHEGATYSEDAGAGAS